MKGHLNGIKSHRFSSFHLVCNFAQSRKERFFGSRQDLVSWFQWGRKAGALLYNLLGVWSSVCPRWRAPMVDIGWPLLTLCLEVDIIVDQAVSTLWNTSSNVIYLTPCIVHTRWRAWKVRIWLYMYISNMTYCIIISYYYILIHIKSCRKFFLLTVGVFSVSDVWSFGAGFAAMADRAQPWPCHGNWPEGALPPHQLKLRDPWYVDPPELP